MARLSSATAYTRSAPTRLSAIAPLDAPSLFALREAVSLAHPMRNHSELVGEGKEIAGPRLIVSGWAARQRFLPDGRRQILSFLLPGDLIGNCSQPRPIAVSSVVALSDLFLSDAPAAKDLPALGAAYAISAALEESYLLAHITRLGRLSALERIADLMLELYERLTLAGLAGHNRFELPLTQEMLADALGLTSVHINRMLQQLRRNGDIEWKGGELILRDPQGLASHVGRAPARVTALHSAPAD